MSSTDCKPLGVPSTVRSREKDGEQSRSSQTVLGNCWLAGISRETKRLSWWVSMLSVFHTQANFLKAGDSESNGSSMRCLARHTCGSRFLGKPAGGLDMFARMAEDILDMLAAYGNMDDQTLFQLFLGRIKAWQEFMYEGRAEVLGPEAEIGLAGELCFLRLLLERGVPDMAVLDGWQGPLNGLHDFLVGYRGHRG